MGWTTSESAIWALQLITNRIPLRHLAKFHYIRIRTKYGPAVANPWNKIYVSPDAISRCYSFGYDSTDDYYRRGGYWTADDEFIYDHWQDAGEIENGTWDLKTLCLSNLPKYRGVEDYFIHNVPWENTDLFRYYMRLIRDGITIDGCSSKQELLKRYGKIEIVCKDIKENGYRDREELCEPKDFRCLMDEVRINIGRDGELIFYSGWHRLAAAKLFGIDQIPVRVMVRHENWHQIRRNIYRVSDYSDLTQDQKDFLPHPDLVDVLPDNTPTNPDILS